MSYHHTGATERLRLAVLKSHGMLFPLPDGIRRSIYKNRLRTCAISAGLRVSIYWMPAVQAFSVTPKVRA